MKKPFVSLEQIQEIKKTYPTPFYIYDQKGIRENARAVNRAFSWNKGFREYFAVKATPTPGILQILKEEGCGADCSSYTELQIAEAVGVTGHQIMFSSNVTPAEDFLWQRNWVLSSTLTILPIFLSLKKLLQFLKPYAAVTIPAVYSR